MPLTLYNSLTKKEAVFEPRMPGVVTMYTCGPTVYGRPHIGNYSSFLMADLLRRWLEVGHGYTVKHVKNITDVGHLVADADDGEDKIEKQARLESGSTDVRSVHQRGSTDVHPSQQRGSTDVRSVHQRGSTDPHKTDPHSIDPLRVARRYEAMYLEDEKALNLLEPTSRPRATEYIKEMLSMTKTLIANGNAYETGDGIYFSVETFKQYGKLSGNTLEKLNAGARIKVDEAKRHPADFALWKKCVGSNGHHLLRWSFTTGERTATFGDDESSGFPGWHIECSAMSSALLGEEIDIHTGGEDNIFPHHECEIAQSECAFGHTFVRHWLHKRRIDLAGEKMSKSLGNVLTLPDIVAKGYSPLDLRCLFLSVHYRTNLKFSEKGIDDARHARRSIVQWMSECESIGTDQLPKHTEGAQQFFDGYIAPPIHHFTNAMDADLNVSSALACIFDLMSITRRAYADQHISEKAHADLLAFIHRVRHTFGCFDPEVVSIPPEAQVFLDARALARKNKDFKESDRLRDELKKLGYEVRDTGAEQVVKKM